MAACAGIFRVNRGEYIGSFSYFLGVQNTIYAETMGVPMEYTWNAKFRKLSIECDSTLVCLAFTTLSIVP